MVVIMRFIKAFIVCYIVTEEKGRMSHIDFDDFMKVDIRVGRVVSVDEFPEARTPAYIVRVDFGEELGVKKSSAQLTKHYKPKELVGTLVSAVVNFPPKQIGPLKSEVLIVGFPDEEGKPVLVRPDQDVPLGGKLY